MVNNRVYTNKHNILNGNIIAIINKLKNQNERADIDSIHKQLVKTNTMQDLTKEDLLKKVHDLETEGKSVNKLHQNKDSFQVSKNILDAFVENILEKTPIRFPDSSFETLNINQTDSQSFPCPSSRESRISSIPDFDIIANTPTALHINHDTNNIRETESLVGNKFEKLKVDDIKRKIISELQKSIEKLFQNKLSHLKQNMEN